MLSESGMRKEMMMSFRIIITCSSLIPVKFVDRNSDFYYCLGLIDWRIRLLRLPSEVFNKRGKPVRIIIGDVIAPEEQDRFADTEKFGKFLRESVYNLSL